MLCGFIRLGVMQAQEQRDKQVRPVPLPAIGPIQDKRVELFATSINSTASEYFYRGD